VDLGWIWGGFAPPFGIPFWDIFGQKSLKNQIKYEQINTMKNVTKK
jgi:hypothetical protein